jgi:hypothetical protein
LPSSCNLNLADTHPPWLLCLSSLVGR